MTLLEYIKSMDKEDRVIYTDGHSNGIYIDIVQIYKSEYEDWLLAVLSPVLTNLVECPLYRPSDNLEDIRFIDGQELEFLNKTNIIIDEEVAEYNSYARRPYFRLRGKRVTEQQAFDIIRGTIFDFRDRKGDDCGDVYTLHLPEWFIECDHKLSHYSWCHPNGVIGVNGITDKYPNILELIGDMINIKHAFPYLDFVMAITDWNEVPPEKWDWNEELQKIKDRDKYSTALHQLDYREYPNFLDNLEIGIWVHDDVIEFMGPSRTRKIYRQYVKKYEEPNKDIYVPRYYTDNKEAIKSNKLLNDWINKQGGES